MGRASPGILHTSARRPPCVLGTNGTVWTSGQPRTFTPSTQMKITAIALTRWNDDTKDPVILDMITDLSEFSFLTRGG